MTINTENSAAPQWNLKAFIVALRAKEAEGPGSLGVEERALIEIIENGSPGEYAAEMEYLVGYAKQCFERNNVSKKLTDSVNKLATARAGRPTTEQIKAAIEAGVFDRSPEEQEAARRAVADLRRHAAVAHVEATTT